MNSNEVGNHLKKSIWRKFSLIFYCFLLFITHTIVQKTKVIVILHSFTCSFLQSTIFIINLPSFFNLLLYTNDFHFLPSFQIRVSLPNDLLSFYHLFEYVSYKRSSLSICHLFKCIFLTNDLCYYFTILVIILMSINFFCFNSTVFLRALLLQASLL